MSKKPTRTPKSDTEAKSRASTGAQSVSVYLLPEERKLWDQLASERGMSKKDTFIAGLRALEARPAVTKAAVLAWIEANASDPVKQAHSDRTIKVAKVDGI